jgi:iron complex transport system substrate-binding protein
MLSALPAYSLTLTDEVGRTIELDKPIERAVVIGSYDLDIIAAIGGGDRIVGVAGHDFEQYRKAGAKWVPEQTVGEMGQINYEAVIAADPDALILYANGGWEEAAKQLAPFDIPVIVASGWKNDRFDENVTLLGEAFGLQDGAKRVHDFRQRVYAEIDKRIAGKAPRTVYYENEIAYQTPTKGSGFYEAIVRGGGKSIFEDVVFGKDGRTQGTVWKTPIDAGEVLTRDPDVIIREFGNSYSGSTAGVFAAEKAELLARPGWSDLKAAQDNNIYIVNAYQLGQQAKTLTSLYVASWLYPEAFADLNPDDLTREWVEKYLGLKHLGGDGVYFTRVGKGQS